MIFQLRPTNRLGITRILRPMWSDLKALSKTPFDRQTQPKSRRCFTTNFNRVGIGIPKRFPGRTGKNEQYGLYKGQIVPGSNIANIVYGSASHAAGIPIEGAMGAAQTARLLFSSEHKLDQPADQWSVVSGYADRQYGNPWRYGTYSNINPAQTNDPLRAWAAYRIDNPIPGISQPMGP
jgi:hypothetical protein